MIKIHKICENDADKFLDLVTSIDEEASYLLFDQKERKRDIDLTKSYILKLNNNPYSILLVASDKEGNFLGYAAGEQYSLQRLQHTLNINIAISRKRLRNFINLNISSKKENTDSNKSVGIQLLNQLIENAKKNSIHRLEATIISKNRACIALVNKLGVKLEGIKKDAIKINNQYYDLYMMAKILNN